MEQYIIATCKLCMTGAGVQVNKLKQRLADSKDSRLYCNTILKSPSVCMIYPNMCFDEHALKVMTLFQLMTTKLEVQARSEDCITCTGPY